jgi:hypothetical protein
VKQYQSQNIINTTTNNYQLIVSEDLSLNGRMFVSGNVGIGKTNPAVALDVSGDIYTNSITKRTTGYVAFTSSTDYTWFLLGRYDSTSNQNTGASFILDIAGGSGYDAGTVSTSNNYSGGKTTIYGRSLNNSNASVANIDLSYKFEGSSLAAIVQVIGVQVSTNRNQYDIYVLCRSYSQCVLNVDTVTLSSFFTVNSTITTSVTAPSTTASSTVCVGKSLISMNGGNLILNDPAYPTATTYSPNNSTATANSWTTSNAYPWTATNSSSYATYFSPYTAFLTNLTSNNNTANCGWMSSTNSYTVNTGAYNTTTYSTIMQNGAGTVYGEWLQIQSAIPLVLRDFNLSTYYFNSNSYLYTVSRLPYKFYICGSTDSTTWYPIIYVSNWSGLPTTTASGQVGEKTNTFTIPSGITTGGTLTGSTVTGPSSARTITYSTYGNSNNAYTYFRLVVTGVNGTQNGASSGDGAGSVSTCGCLWSPTFINAQNSSISYSNGATIINSPTLIVNNGFVGIGTATPIVPLHITANGVDGPNGTGSYFVASGGLITTSGTFTGISLFSSGGIMSRGSISSISGIYFSDKRIKENITNMDSSIIQKFREIQPKVYQYIDKLQYGNDEHYGVIAQEMEEILPCAIQYQKLHVPNIYDMADISKNIIILKTKSTSNLEYDASGILFPKLKCYDISNNEITVNITKIIDDKSFEIDVTQETSQIFVYGQEVNNHRGINYDTIFMLSFYVTQLLDKEVLDLKSENQELKTQMSDILSRLSALENK